MLFSHIRKSLVCLGYWIHVNRYLSISDNKIVRSLTSEDVASDKAEVEAPKPVPRNKTSGNISSMTEAPQRPRDSPPSVQARTEARPVPAPRREIQSMVINEGVQSKPSRGPPPLPPTRPQSWMPSTQKVSDDQTYAVVNKLTDSCNSASQNIIDAPLPLDRDSMAERDPFDTSSVPSQFLNQASQTKSRPPVSRPPPPVPIRHMLNNQDLATSASSDIQNDQTQWDDFHSNSENSQSIPSFSSPEVQSLDDSSDKNSSSMGPPSESPPPVPLEFSEGHSPDPSPTPPSDSPPSEPPPPLPSEGPPLEPPPPLPSEGPPSEAPPPPPVDKEDQFAEFKANFDSFQNSATPLDHLPPDPPNHSPQEPRSRGPVPSRVLPPVPTRGPATGNPPVPKRPMNHPPVPPRS